MHQRMPDLRGLPCPWGRMQGSLERLGANFGRSVALPIDVEQSEIQGPWIVVGAHAPVPRSEVQPLRVRARESQFHPLSAIEDLVHWGLACYFDLELQRQTPG